MPNPSIPSNDGIDPMRFCVRCGEPVHMSAENQPHLCADVAKRLVRREKQVDAVLKLFEEYAVESNWPVLLAEAIVSKLSQIGVTDD